MENTQVNNWYVIRTQYNCERKLLALLIKAGVEAEVPTYTTLKQWSDRKKKCEVPLLNSVVFVKVNAQKLNDVYQYSYVTGVLKDQGKPAAVRPEEMEVLRAVAKEWSGETVSQLDYEQQFEPGTPVKIYRGPFKGLTGELIELKGKHQVRIAIQSIQVQFVLDLPKSQIKNVSQ